MPGVTQPTEKPGKYEEKYNAVVKQMTSDDRLKKKYSKEEIEVMVKNSLIREANDKMDFSLRGEIRRGRHIKMGMDADAFGKLWKSKMKKRLEEDGFPFVLTPAEEKILATVAERTQKEKIEEITNIASEAMKKILSSA